MGNENEFEFEGKVYVALRTDVDNCIGCEMRHLPCYKVAKCARNERVDGVDVIFVEKHR